MALKIGDGGVGDTPTTTPPAGPPPFTPPQEEPECQPECPCESDEGGNGNGAGGEGPGQTICGTGEGNTDNQPSFPAVNSGFAKSPYAGKRSPNRQLVYSLNGEPNPLDDAVAVLSQVRPYRLQVAGGGAGCHVDLAPGDVNPSSGNVLLTLRVTPAALTDPPVTFFYNSTLEYETEVGDRWTGLYQQVATIDGDTGDIVILQADGRAYQYTPGVGDVYQAPPGITNSVRYDSGSGIVYETQQDGTELHYRFADVVDPSVNQLLRIKPPGGGTWTVLRDATTFVPRSVVTPYGRRTTFTYTGGYLTGVTDPAGRTTSFTRTGGSPELMASVTTPELCQTSFGYSGGVLRNVVTPGGSRYTYTLDGDGRLSLLVLPGGGRVTCVFSAHPATNTVKNPRNQVVTLLSDSTGNVRAVYDAPGQRTTYTWSGMQLRAIQNPFGYRTTFLYATLSNNNLAQRVRAVVYPEGSRYSLSFDSNDRLVGLQNELGNRTTLLWDGNGLRRATVDPMLGRTTYTYASDGQMRTVKNPLGEVVTFVYNALGQRSAIVNPLGFRTSIAYDSKGYRRRLTDPLGNIVTYLRDDVNRVRAAINELGYRATFTYDLDGRRTTSKNPLGFVTTTLYGTNGRVKAIVQPTGARTTYGYDAACNTTTVTNPLGRVTTFVYDALNRPSATVDALGNRGTVTYDLAGNPKTTKDPLGYATTTLYDERNRPRATIDPLGRRTTYAYDRASDLTRVQSPLGRTITFVHDKLRRPTATENPLGQRTTTTFDAASRPRRVTDALGRIITTLYDAAGQPRAMINAVGARVTEVYDPVGRRKAHVDANDRRTTFGYDATGQVRFEQDPLLRRTTHTYDAAGRQATKLDARGVLVTFTYDANNRLTGRRYSDGTRATFVYDLAGNRTLMRDPVGRTTFAYDAVDRVRFKHQQNFNRITYGYDAVGQRRFMVNSDGGRTTYSYDGAGQIRFLSNPQGERTTFAFDEAGRRTSVRLANGSRSSYAYDAADQLLRLSNLNSSPTTLSSFRYTYDAVGNRLNVVEGSGDRVTWTFDAAYQLRREQRNGAFGYDVTHTYDPVGNRRIKIASAARTTFNYDAANQLTTSVDGSGTTTYTYDGAGNQRISEPPTLLRTTYAWDGENRMTALRIGNEDTGPDGGNYSYNADHQMLESQEINGGAASSLLRWIWDGQNILIRRGFSTLDTYTYEPLLYGNLVSLRRSTGTSYYLFDGLGSTDRVINAAESTVANYIYNAFGEQVASSGVLTNYFRWLGQIGYFVDRGDTALLYVRRRWYRPGQARWLSVDPVWAAYTYAYTNNAPLTWYDPAGLIPLNPFPPLWKWCKSWIPRRKPKPPKKDPPKLPTDCSQYTDFAKRECCKVAKKVFGDKPHLDTSAVQAAIALMCDHFETAKGNFCDRLASKCLQEFAKVPLGKEFCAAMDLACRDNSPHH